MSTQVLRYRSPLAIPLVVLAAVLLGLAAAKVIGAMRESWSTVLLELLTAGIFVAQALSGTTVVPGEVRIRNLLGVRRVPRSHIAEVPDPDHFGNTLSIILHDGEVVPLTYVRPTQVAAVRETLGIPGRRQPLDESTS